MLSNLARAIRIPIGWRALISKGSKMQTTWRLEWTWNADGSVTLDALQSDTLASVPVPVESVGNGLDVALGARILVRFPTCSRAWLPAQPAFETPTTDDEQKWPMARLIDPSAGTMFVDFGSPDSNPLRITNPVEGSRARLTLFLENMT